MSEQLRKYYLFSEPTAVDGAARIFDFAGSMQIYNSHKTEAEADACEIYHDWRTVGSDILNAAEIYSTHGK